MAINIDQQRIEEYEGAADWSSGSNLTPTGAPDWSPPVYAEGEEPPLQWLLDAALPLLVGGGAGAAVVGRKKIAKEALKVLNKIKGTKAQSAIPRGVPLYDKAGNVIGVDSRTVPYSSVKSALKKVGPSQARFTDDIPYQNLMNRYGNTDNMRMPAFSFEFLKSLPKSAKEAYKKNRTKQQKELAKRLTDIVNDSRLNPRVKGAEKVYSPRYKGPHPEYRDIGPVSMNSPFYGAHNISQAKKFAGGSMNEHMKQSILKSNPEITKKSVTDKIIDTLLGID